ncbi:MAG: response regulator [Lachnospiraceae bacterium]|nr:response regulator [Lachnospiraceae bacterium]
MKYKILITGKNDSAIDGFFAQMSDYFEILSTSIRYEDVTAHMNYFVPDVFVCCLYKESQEQISKTAAIKRRLSQLNIPFMVIGTREDCARFEAGAPRVSDLTIALPSDVNTIKGEILKLIQKSKMSAKASAPSVNPEPAKPAAPSASPASAKPTAPSASQEPAKPAAPSVSSEQDKPTAAPISQSVSPERAKEAAPSVSLEPEVPKAPEKRELSTGLINEALTSEKAYVELVDAIERHVNLLEAGIVRRKHILIVDDDAMMLKLMKEYLHDNYDVATALNGKIALKFLERKKTDLILLDYEMPGENGPAVLEQLRASVDTKGIPVIFLTGVTEGKKIQEVLALKPQGYLLKPVQRGKLVEAIEKVIR